MSHWQRMRRVIALALLLACSSGPKPSPAATRGTPATRPPTVEPVTATLEVGEMPGPVREHADLLIATGFASRDSIVERVLYAAEGGHPRATIAAWVDQRFAAHLAAQETWPEVTDADRLVRAFAALDAAGILARHSYGMHGPDALSLIGYEAQRACGQGRSVRGYVLYDGQAAETLPSGWLELAWDAFVASEWSGERATRELHVVGDEILGALREQGLSAELRVPSRSLRIAPLDWKARRQPGSFASTFVTQIEDRSAPDTGPYVMPPCEAAH